MTDSTGAATLESRPAQTPLGSAATAQVIEDELAGLVLGYDAFAVPAANDRMSRAVRNAGSPGIAAGAVSAVDTALCRRFGLCGDRIARIARTLRGVYGVT
ncbi:hypothetical protein [Streptomyces pseudoechinosporeus]